MSQVKWITLKKYPVPNSMTTQEMAIKLSESFPGYRVIGALHISYPPGNFKTIDAVLKYDPDLHFAQNYNID